MSAHHAMDHARDASIQSGRGPDMNDGMPRRVGAGLASRGATAMSVGVLERYGDLLPLTDSTPRITLGEGSTPLIRSRRIEAATGHR